MEQRMCLRGHTWGTGERICPSCGELGASISGDSRESDNERRRRARERVEADPYLLDRFWGRDEFEGR